MSDSRAIHKVSQISRFLKRPIRTVNVYLGNRNSFTYNANGRETQSIDPLNRRTTTAYDAAGRQNLRIDARENRTTYTHNAVDQPGRLHHKSLCE